MVDMTSSLLMWKLLIRITNLYEYANYEYANYEYANLVGGYKSLLMENLIRPFTDWLIH